MTPGTAYPSDRARKHFSHKFTRLMVKTCLCQELGAGAFALLATVVHTEDAAGYRRPVTFFNEQLMCILGMSRDQLVRVRQRCVEQGWLHYEAGRKSKAGRYWVTVPREAEGLDDLPSDESYEGDSVRDSDGIVHSHSLIPSGNQTANQPKTRQQTRRKPDSKPAPFFPTPAPTPKSNAPAALKRRWRPNPNLAVGEFRSLERGYERFQEACLAGIVHPLDELRWLTMWANLGRRLAEDRIQKPGGVLIACLRDRDWPGDGDDEDRAHAFLKALQQQGHAEPLPELAAVANNLAVESFGQEVDDAA